mmetsp:Transcript_7549/g.28375  ORF Transcript_7549/g.28375 Transcript_7549/m.28375 type:complete len:185 (-) Transcript_7549:457-1011(-)
MRKASRKRKHGGYSTSNKNRVHYSIEDTVVFKNLSKPRLPPTILPIEKEKRSKSLVPFIYPMFDGGPMFDATKFISFLPMDDASQWNKLMESTMALEDQLPDLSLNESIVLRSIGVHTENSETADRLWQKSRADFFTKQKREELKQKKLEQQQLALQKQMAVEDDTSEADEEIAEGLDEFGSFM